MPVEPQDGPSVPPRAGDRRGPDRRSADRRRTDRRSPLPYWRRPAALVAYGAVGALLVLAVVMVFVPEAPPPVSGPITEVEDPRPKVADAPPAAVQPAVPAYTSADFERLVVEGAAASGRRVLAELSCETPVNMALRDVPEVEAAVAPLVGPDGRVPAAQCRWGRLGETRRGELVLLIPPSLASQFASAPETTDAFVRRRRLLAEVEWIGRSQSLALRNAAVYRGPAPR